MASNPHDPFVPDDFISISSTCGHIGRFYWNNQLTFTVETWGEDGAYERFARELPGSCVLASVMGNWWAA